MVCILGLRSSTEPVDYGHDGKRKEDNFVCVRPSATIRWNGQRLRVYME